MFENSYGIIFEALFIMQLGLMEPFYFVVDDKN